MKSSITKDNITALRQQAIDNKNANLCLELAEIESSLEYILLAKIYNPQHDFFANDNNIYEFISKHSNSINNEFFDLEDFDELYMHQAVEWLFNTIANHPKITSINFLGYINDIFGVFLSKAKYLKTLEFSYIAEGSYIEPTQAAVLASGLSKNTTLKNLLLCDQDIKDEGLLAILDALKQNPKSKLKYINLSCCKLTNVSAKALLAHIKENNSLLDVSLFKNRISNDFIQNINLAIQQKKLSMNEKDAQINMTVEKPSPILINYASMAPKNTEKMKIVNTTDLNNQNKSCCFII